MSEGNLTLTIDRNDLARLNRALSQLSELESNAVVQKGLQEGVAVFKKKGKVELKQTLSKKPHNIKMAAHMANRRGGGLMKGFSNKVLKKKGKGYAGFTKYGHHAHLVSEGTKQRYTKTGAARGAVTGSRFWKINFEKNKEEASRKLLASITASINRIILRNQN